MTHSYYKDLIILKEEIILSGKLTEFEKKVYDFIKEHNEMIVSNVPKKMSGAIPNLIKAGLLKTFRKPTTPWASKKKTFVKAINKKHP
jgi:hypothetical protein